MTDCFLLQREGREARDEKVGILPWGKRLKEDKRGYRTGKSTTGRPRDDAMHAVYCSFSVFASATRLPILPPCIIVCWSFICRARRGHSLVQCILRMVTVYSVFSARSGCLVSLGTEDKLPKCCKKLQQERSYSTYSCNCSCRC